MRSVPLSDYVLQRGSAYCDQSHLPLKSETASTNKQNGVFVTKQSFGVSAGVVQHQPPSKESNADGTETQHMHKGNDLIVSQDTYVGDESSIEFNAMVY